MPDEQRHRLERLARLPEAEIDTSDIPEVKDWSDGVRGAGPEEVDRMLRDRALAVVRTG